MRDKNCENEKENKSQIVIQHIQSNHTQTY